MRTINSENIYKNLIEWIGIRSDSNTLFEHHFAEVLMEKLKTIPYFINHPHQYGLSMIEDDKVGRGVVWAYVDKGANETVILFGHHDVVSTKHYGKHEGIALQPMAIKEALKDQMAEASDKHWLFGRGSADMKAGLALQLEVVETAIDQDLDVNVLWLSLPDEEHLSAGMRHAMSLLVTLKDTFKMTYKLAIQSEPHHRENPSEYVIHSGSVGKIMPIIVTKGVPSHAGEIYSGFNPIGMMMEVIKAINLNTEMSERFNGEMTTPPTFLGIIDDRDQYDVTTPEYIGAYFNWTFLTNQFEKKMAQLKELCVWSMEDAINQFNYSYNEYLRKQGLKSYECCQCITPRVLTLKELLDQMPDYFDYEAFCEEWVKETKTYKTHEDMFHFVKALIELADISEPVTVIALMSPFYPATNSYDYYSDEIKPLVHSQLMARGMTVNHQHFFKNISDMSYFAPPQGSFQTIVDNSPEFRMHYHFDYESFSQVAVPSINVGPWGKNLHLKTECVYLPDVLENTPHLILEILKSL